ncbi:jg19751 [Pararge aegeria aegeria]|uniref:Jg19751 protein n=1 Tax=Pararge aegeria aegeria TaxID=348720 RepID=A0A8S4QWU9_9NEOP|nr:jg19751 [Pararge aegeria aegeria]
MLQRFIELEDEIKCAISNLDSTNLMNLTTYEWDLCKSLIVVLQPCEEVTREMSGQKYVSGSSVLPITVGLTSALREIADLVYQQSNDIAAFPDEIEMCRQDLLSEITTRFANVENSKTFTTAMFLDPRYKLYFENQSIAENTKKHVISLVAAMIVNDESVLPSTLQPVEPTTIKQSLIWKHYNKKNAEFPPSRNAQ